MYRFLTIELRPYLITIVWSIYVMLSGIWFIFAGPVFSLTPVTVLFYIVLGAMPYPESWALDTGYGLRPTVLGWATFSVLSTAVVLILNLLALHVRRLPTKSKHGKPGQGPGQS